MTYLLDVNVLMGLALTEHQFHRRVRTWIVTLDRESDLLGTCSVTELGLVRILPQITATSVNIKGAQATLTRVKAASFVPFIFIADNVGGDRLPKWVQQSKQTTDGHLLELARAHGVALATCDKKIPGAFIIPA